MEERWSNKIWCNYNLLLFLCFLLRPRTQNKEQEKKNRAEAKLYLPLNNGSGHCLAAKLGGLAPWFLQLPHVAPLFLFCFLYHTSRSLHNQHTLLTHKMQERVRKHYRFLTTMPKTWLDKFTASVKCSYRLNKSFP